MAGNLGLRNFYYMAELTETFNYWTFTLSHASFKDSPLNLKHFHAKVNFPVYHFSLFYNENCLINVPPWVTGKKANVSLQQSAEASAESNNKTFPDAPTFFCAQLSLNRFINFKLLSGALFASRWHSVCQNNKRDKHTHNKKKKAEQQMATAIP